MRQSAAALERYAHLNADFLMKHSRPENGNCVFLTNREGEKKLSGGIYNSSIYVDCFVIIGLAEYGGWCAKMRKSGHTDFERKFALFDPKV